MNSVLDSKRDEQQATAEPGQDPVGLLRRFHFGEPAAAGQTAMPEPSVLPALLNDYRDATVIRYQYPLYLAPADGSETTDLARPVSEHFATAIVGFALGPDDARILRDNLPWIERYLKEALGDDGPLAAPELFAEAAAAMQAIRARPSMLSPVLSNALGPIRITAPANPARNPRVFARVIRSDGTKTWASGSTSSGTTAMVTPAKPEAT